MPLRLDKSFRIFLRSFTNGHQSACLWGRVYSTKHVAVTKTLIPKWELEETQMPNAIYDTIGKHYGNFRSPDSRIAALISRELEDLRSIVNLGAGAGSYEPVGRRVVAVEPSMVMIAQRGKKAAPVVQAYAEALPFGKGTFDGAMALLTIHHWSDVRKGLAEALRVARRKVVLLTRIDFDVRFWLFDYLPQLRKIDERTFPSLDQLSSWMGPARSVIVPIPHDCTDGFLCAYWRRPEAYLDPDVRRAISSFSRIQNADEGLKRLQDDLSCGAWSKRYSHIFEKREMDFGYRLIVAGER